MPIQRTHALRSFLFLRACVYYRKFFFPHAHLIKEKRVVNAEHWISLGRYILLVCQLVLYKRWCYIPTPVVSGNNSLRVCYELHPKNGVYGKLSVSNKLVVRSSLWWRMPLCGLLERPILQWQTYRFVSEFSNWGREPTVYRSPWAGYRYTPVSCLFL